MISQSDILTGVSWCRRSKRFQVSCLDATGKRKSLGYFDDLMEAAYAYAAYAKEKHGKFYRKASA